MLPTRPASPPPPHPTPAPRAGLIASLELAGARLPPSFAKALMGELQARLPELSPAVFGAAVTALAAMGAR